MQVFGPGTRQRLSPPATATNYIYWRGGVPDVRQATMSATDLELIDEDPSDPSTSQSKWNDQLVAGYSKVTLDRGLKASYDKISETVADRAQSRWDRK